MDVLSEVVEKGVVERRFDLKVDGEVVPGIFWAPEGETGPRPVILIGHGGTQHKRVVNVLGLARRFVRHLGYAAVAIDAPDHGDRIANDAAAISARRDLQSRLATGRSGEPAAWVLSPEEARAWANRTERGGIEWRAVLDDLEATKGLTDGRFGYWGVSMGTIIGLPFVASEPRVGAAVLGLSGLGERPGAAAFEEAARRLTIPVLFVFQWDDELMTRESGLALFDALGSKQKTMHIHPGGHVQTPAFERDAYDGFFERHLGRPA